MSSRPRPVRRETIRSPEYSIHILGAPRASFRDLYHVLLRVRWWTAFGVIIAGYLLLNLLFAAIYMATGGVANAAPDSFADCFFFSVQTMGTIGYGAMYPASPAANTVAVAESVTGLIVTALATGLVFVRFSQIRARLRFSRAVAVSPMNGVPTLAIRIGNERRHPIVNAVFRLTYVHTTKTAEGHTFYRTEDITLMRDHAPTLARAWVVMHAIGPGSPLFGATPASLVAEDAELTLSVSGVDDTSMQAMHARFRWTAAEIVFGARLADMIHDVPGGDMTIDLTHFDALTATEATAAFPYPAPVSAGAPN